MSVRTWLLPLWGAFLRRGWIGLICLLGPLLLCAQETPSAPAAAGGDMLRLLDGSSLHGTFLGLDPQTGVRWVSPSANQEITFAPEEVSSIQFQNEGGMTRTGGVSTCCFRFQNGDILYGRLISLNNERVELETNVGQKLSAARHTLKSVTLFPKGLSILYEGPSGLQGWVTGRGPNKWEYQDGAFISHGVDTLGRDFKLSRSCSVSMDMAWTSGFNMVLALYTDVVDRFNYNGNSYLLFFGTGYVSAQRMKTGAGAIALGQKQLPRMLDKNQMHVEVRVHKETATLELYIDGELVERWKDNEGFAGSGTGLLLYSQMDSVQVRISKLKVSEWDGPYQGEPAPVKNEEENKLDRLMLLNRDKISGSILDLKEGKVSVAVASNQFTIPLARLTQIAFAADSSQTNGAGKGLVRVELLGGARLTFRLEQWNETQVTGVSEAFGPMQFKPNTIRHLQMNLDRPEAAEKNNWEPEALETNE